MFKKKVINIMKACVFSDFEILGGKFMNKNFKSKLVAGLMTTAMLFSSAAAFAPVHAADETTQTNPSVLKFNEYLVTSEDLTNAPKVSFDFTLSVPTTTTNAGTLTIKPGEDLTSVKLNGKASPTTSVAFNGETLTSNNDNKVHKTDSQKYASKEVSVDFSDVTWPDPGIYRYIITQSGPAQFSDSFPVENNDKDKAIDVYVIRNDSNQLVVNTIVMHSDETAGYTKDALGNTTVIPTNDTTTDNKIERFQNTYDSKVLGFDKKTYGNQRSENDLFTFRIKVENLMPGTTYNYKVQPTTANTNVTNSTITTGDTETSKEFDISLNDGGSFELYGLNLHAKYTVTETVSKGYTLSMGNWSDAQGIDNNGIFDGNNNAITDTDLTGDARFGLINTKNGNVPTGIIFAVAPFAVGAVVLAAFIIVKMRRTAKQ
ncbi:hypothetical protein FYJ79_11515 [Sharpea azabuensis]|uniref:DUF7601 domain-containing protein n=2 Tax=Sharpea porci TaxID=2652286 RepID=A0A844FX20_9FIRM|nr:hypothetical protein [Sharpea porci]